MPQPYQLFAASSTGSAITEAVLKWKKAPYKIISVDYVKDVLGEKARISKLNPLSEVPTLILPNGKPMTESAAMAFYLEETFKSRPLFPKPGSRDRAEVLKWLIFIVANIYPTFTYGDDPSDWIKTKSAREELRESTKKRCQELWLLCEGAAKAKPYWMGKEISILDIYVFVMSHWRPGRKWFEDHCPKLIKISEKVGKHPDLISVWERNFKT